MVPFAPVVTTSLRSRPGHQYEPVAEAEVHSLLPTLALGLPGAARHGAVMVRECPGPYGIADLVVLIGGQRQLERRRDADVPPLLSELDAAIVAMLQPVRPTPTDQLAIAVDRPLRSVARRLSALGDLGAISARPSGFVRNPALDLRGSVHALEAKTKDWNRGIDQALAYAVWADTSTLVVGQLPRDTRLAEDRAGRLRLGLASGLRWVRRPSRRTHERPLRMWAMEHLVAALGGYHPSSAM